MYFSQGKLGRVCTYIQHVWGIIGHLLVEAGNVAGTDNTPPQVPPKLCGGRLRGWVGSAGGRCEAGGRMLTLMMLLVALSVEGWRSPVTAAPAVSAAALGQVAPAQRGDPCAGAWLAPYLPVSGLPWGGVWTPCRFSHPSLGERNVLTAPALGKTRRRPGKAAAAHRPGGPAQSGPAVAPPEVLMELALSCASSAVAGGRSWWSVGRLGKTATATRRCWWTGLAGSVVSRIQPPRWKLAVLPEWGCDAKHHPWKVVAPVGSGGPRPQGVLQPPVEPFYQSVWLRMVCCRGRMLDVEQTAEARPQGGRELGPPFRCDGGNSKPGYPTGEEGLVQSVAVMDERGMATSRFGRLLWTGSVPRRLFIPALQ